MFYILESDVLIHLQQHKKNFTSGPDGIPGFILYNYPEHLAWPATALLNLSLQTSTFPLRWKISRKCSIYKNNSNIEVTNYQPISLISKFV